MTSGTAGCTRVKRSSNLDSNIGGEAFRESVRRMAITYTADRIGSRVWLRSDLAFVHAVRAHDPAAHGLQSLVHVAVALEDPARLALVLRPHAGRVEVLDVELGGDAGVLVLGLDAE